MYLSKLYHHTKFRDITLNGTNITDIHTAATFTVLNILRCYAVTVRY